MNIRWVIQDRREVGLYGYKQGFGASDELGGPSRDGDAPYIFGEKDILPNT